MYTMVNSQSSTQPPRQHLTLLTIHCLPKIFSSGASGLPYSPSSPPILLATAHVPSAGSSSSLQLLVVGMAPWLRYRISSLLWLQTHPRWSHPALKYQIYAYITSPSPPLNFRLGCPTTYSTPLIECPVVSSKLKSRKQNSWSSPHQPSTHSGQKSQNRPSFPSSLHPKTNLPTKS